MWFNYGKVGRKMWLDYEKVSRKMWLNCGKVGRKMWLGGIEASIKMSLCKKVSKAIFAVRNFRHFVKILEITCSVSLLM